MSTHKENEDKNEVYEQSKPRTRIREVDFMRIEDTMHGQALSHFELKVKEKIACAPSPYDEIAQREEQEEESEEIRRRLSTLAKKAKLTPQQKACFQMVYLERLSEKEVARCLAIAERNVRRLKRSILKALKLVHEKQLMKQTADGYGLTEKQRLAVSLFYEEQLSRKEIAQRLQMSVPALDKFLQRIRRNFFKKK